MSYTIFTAVKNHSSAETVGFIDSGKLFFEASHQFFAALHLCIRTGQTKRKTLPPGTMKPFLQGVLSTQHSLTQNYNAA